MTTASRFKELSKDSIMWAMSYLENRDLGVLRQVSKNISALASLPGAFNQKTYIEWRLRQDKPFHCIYTSERLTAGVWYEPQLVHRVLGDYLVSFPNPRSGDSLPLDPCLLQIRNLKTQVTCQCRMDPPIETCEVAEDPEPVLIVAHRQRGVSVLTLSSLLGHQEGDIQLTALPAPKFSRLAVAPFPPSCNVAELSRPGPAHMPGETDYAPVLCSKNRFVAIGYNNCVQVIDLRQRETSITLSFCDVKGITVEGGDLVCVSPERCAIWCLDKLTGNFCIPYFQVFRDDTSFLFAKRCVSQVVIAYRWIRRNNEKPGDDAKVVGAAYDLGTGEKTSLLKADGFNDGTYVLQAVEESRNYILGLSRDRVERWDKREKGAYKGVIFYSSERIRTMIKVESLFLVATWRSVCLITPVELISPEKNATIALGKQILSSAARGDPRRVDRFPYDRYQCRSMQLNGRYLIIELWPLQETAVNVVDRDNSQVKVFDLLHVDQNA